MKAIFLSIAAGIAIMLICVAALGYVMPGAEYAEARGVLSAFIGVLCGAAATMVAVSKL